MLHLRQSFRRFNHPPQAVVVKLVGGGASRASAKHCAHGDNMVFVLDILMNRVVGKAREGKSAAGEQHFNFVGRREFLDAIEDVSGLVSG